MEICLTCYILMYVKNIKNVFTFTSVLENMVKIQKRKKKKKKKDPKNKKRKYNLQAVIPIWSVNIHFETLNIFVLFKNEIIYYFSRTQFVHCIP